MFRQVVTLSFFWTETCVEYTLRRHAILNAHLATIGPAPLLLAIDA